MKTERKHLEKRKENINELWEIFKGCNICTWSYQGE